MNIKVEQEQNILEFFSRHTLLQSVKCELFIEESIVKFIEALMIGMLDSCPNLRSMHILQTGEADFSLDSSIFRKLTISRLNTLKINFDFKIIPHAAVINHTLKNLSILNPGVSNSTLLRMCDTFRKLTHLEMSNLEDEGLQCIINHLVS